MYPSEGLMPDELFNGFGDFDFTGTEFDDEPIIPAPVPGSARLVIEDRCEALFTSAEWQLCATVNGQVIDTSNKSSKSHDQVFTKRWARLLIRQNQDRLYLLGVDVEKTYLEWEGDLDELKP